jgi:hypothetical protein
MKYVIEEVFSVRTAATAADSFAAILERSKLGIAIAAMIRMMATTISSSIRENPFCLLRMLVTPGIRDSRREYKPTSYRMNALAMEHLKCHRYAKIKDLLNIRYSHCNHQHTRHSTSIHHMLSTDEIGKPIPTDNNCQSLKPESGVAPQSFLDLIVSDFPAGPRRPD